MENPTTTQVYQGRGRAFVREVGREEAIKNIAQATSEWNGVMVFTRWTGGIFNTKEGKPEKPGLGDRVEVSIEDFVDGLRWYAEQVIPKATGMVLSHALSRYRGGVDAECEGVTAFFADADEVGHWGPICKVLQAAGVAYVIDESASSTPEAPRFHLTIPFAVPLCPPSGEPHDKIRAQWKADVYLAVYGWLLGLMSELGELAAEGFDPATTRLIQPVIPGCRQTDGARVPEINWSPGRALDVTKLLDVTGYKAPLPKPPPPTSSTGATVSSGHATPAAGISNLAAARINAFAVDGKVLGGNARCTWVRCPFEGDHTKNTGGKSSTAIMHGTGKFKCHHTSCQARSWSEIEATFSPAAKLVMAKSRGDEGLVRLRQQLDQQQAQYDAAEKLTLDGVKPAVRALVRDTKPGELICVRAPPGSGKTEGAIEELDAMRAGVLASPTHQIADEQEAKLRAKGSKPHRGRGVLRVVDDAGNFACKRVAVVSEIQRFKGNAPVMVCGSCPVRKGCAARRGQAKGDVAVVQHQQLPAARAHRPGQPVAIDESPATYSEVVLSFSQLAEAALHVESDPFWETLDADFAAAMHLWIKIISTALEKATTLEDAAAAYFFTAGGKKLLDRHQVLIAKAPAWVGSKAGTGLLRLVVNLVVTNAKPLNESFTDSKFDKPLADAGPTDSLRVRAIDTLRLIRPLRIFAEQVHRQGEARPFRRRGAKLVVRALTPEMEDIIANGGVLLDATADLALLRAHRPDVREVHLEVPDGAPVQRRVVYQWGASRKGLLPTGRQPNWVRFRGVLVDGLKRARAAGVNKLLVVAYKLIAEELAKPNNPCADLLAAWRAEKRVVEFNHYGNSRGVNLWKDFDGCVSIGDPWPPKVERLEWAAELNIDGDEYMRSIAAGELEQVHGRLRAPSRSAPAFLWHYGAVAPLGWRAGNTEVVTAQRGRPKSVMTTPAAEVAVLVDLLGGAEAAAQVVGGTAKSLRRYVSGERAAPAEVVERLRCGVEALKKGAA